MTTGGNRPPQDAGRGRARPLLRALRGAVATLEWTGKIIAVATLVVMFAALLTNVMLRYAFGAGIPWASEIHNVLLPWMVAGGIVIAAARGRNIAIGLLPDLMPPRVRLLIFLSVNLLIVIIAVSVLWSSQPILRASQFQTLSTLGVKQIWGYASLVYAFGGMAIIAALDMVYVLAARASRIDDPNNSSLS